MLILLAAKQTFFLFSSKNVFLFTGILGYCMILSTYSRHLTCLGFITMQSQLDADT